MGYALLDEGAIHIIYPKMQAALGELGAAIHPKTLDMGDIVEKNSGDGQGFEDIHRGGALEASSGQRIVFTLKGQGDKDLDPRAFLLERAYLFQVFQAMP